MSQALALLEEALDMARQEKNALECGAYDEAIELAQKRGCITGQAWNLVQPGDRAAYEQGLRELLNLQGQLAKIAARAKDAIRERLNRSRQEKRRIQGYHLAVGQALQ